MTDSKGSEKTGRTVRRATVRVPWRDAVLFVGSEEALKAGRDPGTLVGYRNDGVPIQEIGDAVLAVANGKRVIPAAPSVPRHKAVWYRNARTFTAMVEALRLLEADVTKGDESAAERWQAAWRLMIAIRPVIEHLAGWTDKNWQTLEVSRTDHWERITKKREQRTISTAIQEELPL